MVKKNLFKAVMLGLCMAALSANTAFAMQSGAGTDGSAGTEATAPELETLYARQKDIDKILFEDNSKDIEKKGFIVNTTGVMGDVIEIGIYPFSEENADYIYELVGKEDVKVVEFDTSVIYAASEPLIAPEEDSTDIPETETQSANTDDGRMEIQIESIAGDAENAAKDSQAEPVSAPAIILAIAGVAAVAGGAVLYSLRKKGNK